VSLLCCQVVRNVQNILQTNCSVASSLGPPFLSQMSLVYVDMLSVYKCDSLHIPLAHSATDVCVLPVPALLHLHSTLCMPFSVICCQGVK
jgi:hypothetical protein